METPKNLLTKFERMVHQSGLAPTAAQLGIGIRTQTDIVLEEFITTDPDLLTIKEQVRKLAPTPIPILITGETGTGKELIARALHGERKGHFVAVNCAGIPESLLEAEFFGAKRGAFTGCTEDRPGLIDEARDGTLFLDEIGDMPTLLQSKLLRALQSRTFRRVGDIREHPFTARVIAATNIPASKLVDGKTFRSDLYYRIAGFVIPLKPLRQRPASDIAQIIAKYSDSEEIAKLISDSLAKPQPFKANVAMHGNVRELLNIIRATNILH